MGKIKFFLESKKGQDILVIIIVILVGIASFELGRLSKESNDNGLKIDYKGQEANIIDSYNTQNNNIEGNIGNPKTDGYFASSKGKKFYSVSCSAGKTIKQENRIYFSSSTDAINAGYELSSACR